MRIISFRDLRETPWKNGGGITREITAARTGDAIIWRISMADVNSSGAFSRFAGLHRILTVVDGKGMALVSPDRTLMADFAVPVAFDGAWDIEARLLDGHLRDLNLIYDPKLCRAKADVFVGPSHHTLASVPGQVLALHCITDTVTLGGSTVLQKGDTAVVDQEALHVALPAHACALLMTISRVDQ